jgi:hypothetical protein
LLELSIAAARGDLRLGKVVPSSSLPAANSAQQGAATAAAGLARDAATPTMHIKILKHPIQGFEVSVVDAEGRTIQKFTYPTVESARRAARLGQSPTATAR